MLSRDIHTVPRFRYSPTSSLSLPFEVYELEDDAAPFEILAAVDVTHAGRGGARPVQAAAAKPTQPVQAVQVRD